MFFSRYYFVGSNLIYKRKCINYFDNFITPENLKQNIKSLPEYGRMCSYAVPHTSDDSQTLELKFDQVDEMALQKGEKYSQD